MNIPKFKNQNLFIQAFTHRSFLNEAKVKTQSNERLEFLGDSILSYVVSDYLYRKYPEFNEGILTNIRSRLVNTKNLAHLAKELNFGRLLRLSKGEEESQGRENPSLLADCFEAFIGALYIDQGMKVVQDFLANILLVQAEKLIQSKALKDPKSLLQEYIQGKRQGAPIYKVLAEEGPPHTRIFTVGVLVDGVLIGKGKGKSKQQAEENAATVALAQLSSD